MTAVFYTLCFIAATLVAILWQLYHMRNDYLIRNPIIGNTLPKGIAPPKPEKKTGIHEGAMPPERPKSREIREGVIPEPPRSWQKQAKVPILKKPISDDSSKQYIG